MTIKTVKLVSGRVPTIAPANAPADRYQFLSQGAAEPNLGTGGNGSVLTTDTIGTRVWTSNLSINQINSNNIVNSGDVYIGGNLFVSNLFSVASQNLVVSAPLLYLNSNSTYPYNYDIGFYSHFVGGPANLYATTGLVRHDSDNLWYLFSNIPDPVGSNIAVTNSNIIYDTLKLGSAILANTSGTVLTVGGNTAINSTMYARGVYDNGIRVVSTSTGAGNLTISGNSISLTQLGSATTIGSATAIPVITTDAYGRVLSLTSSSISTSFTIAGTTGTTTVPGGSTLSLAGTYGVTVTVGTEYANISTPQDLRTTASPIFSGLSSSGNILAYSATASTSTTTGALVVVGGTGISGNLYVGGNINSNNTISANSVTTTGNITAGDRLTINNGIFWANGSQWSQAFTGNILLAGNLNPGIYIGATTITTSPTLVDTLPVDGNISLRWSLTAKDYINNKNYSGTVDSLNDGSTVTYNEYGVLKTSTSNVVVFTSNITGGNINLWGVGDSANVLVTYERLTLGSKNITGYIQAGNVGPQGPQGPQGISGGYIAAQTTFGSNLVANSATTSTSTTTGALVVVGGAGISGNVFVGNLLATGFFYANGTPFTSSSYGNTQVAAYLPTYSGTIGGDITVGGNLTVTGNTIFRNTEIVTGVEIVAGNLVANSGTASTSTTTGALTVNGGVGIVGNINIASNLAVAGYANIGVTSVTDVAGGTYSDVSLIMPGYGWGMYSNVATAGTYYLRRILAKDSGNNIVIGASGTALNSNVNIISGAGASNSFNVLHTNTLSPLLSVNSLANTVVISNNQSSTSNVTGALIVTGGVGVSGNIYTNNRVGFVYANSVSSVYTIFNQATASYDIVFG